LIERVWDEKIGNAIETFLSEMRAMDFKSNR